MQNTEWLKFAENQILRNDAIFHGWRPKISRPLSRDAGALHIATCLLL